jgi:hypothetical protein
MQTIGKKLRAKWECPHCHNTIIPTDDDRRLGYRPFKYNSMLQMMFQRNYRKNSKN